MLQNTQGTFLPMQHLRLIIYTYIHIFLHKNTALMYELLIWNHFDLSNILAYKFMRLLQN